MASEMQPLVPSREALPNSQVAQPPPSRWRLLGGTAINYFPAAVGGGFGGAAWGAAKLVGSGGIALGALVGIVLDLEKQERVLGDAFQDQRICRIVTTTAKHLLVSGIFAAVLGLSLYFGTKQS